MQENNIESSKTKSAESILDNPRLMLLLGVASILGGVLTVAFAFLIGFFDFIDINVNMRAFLFSGLLMIVAGVVLLPQISAKLRDSSTILSHKYASPALALILTIFAQLALRIPAPVNVAPPQTPPQVAVINPAPEMHPQQAQVTNQANGKSEAKLPLRSFYYGR